MIRRTAWALLIPALLLCACPDKRSTKRRSPDPGSAPVASIPRSDPPLAKWLRRVPADARWAVVSADLGLLRAVLSDVASLLGHHPQIAPVLRQWRARLERRWGGWPLAPETWARLEILRGSGGALYRRADGATVLAFRTRRLGKVLETINQAIRHRGARQVADVKQIRVAGKPAFRFDQWTCATRGEVSWCADVTPARFASVIQSPARTLWRETLSRVDARYLRERLGIWLGPRLRPRLGPRLRPRLSPRLSTMAGFARPLYRAAGRLLGWAPQGLWLAASLGRRIQLYGLALTPSGTSGAARAAASKAAASKAASGAATAVATGPPLPKPGHSGLAATTAAPLVIRLRMPPRRLGDQLHRLVPALAPALDLVRRQRVHGETLAEEMLNGEVVLLSDHAGVAAILGLRSRSGGLRAMKRLMLLLGPRIGDWQKRVRARGRGWDLSYARASLGDVLTHRLILQVPRNAGSGAPRLRNGRMTLLWGVAQHHLVVATDANLFRRILARVDHPDTGFLRQLRGATGRQGFRDHRTLAAYVRPDDPLSALPKAQRAAALRWLGELEPTSRRWANGIRSLLDLTDSATLSCEDLPAGVGCYLGISLLAQPGPGNQQKPSPKPSSNLAPGLKVDARYREALIKKWGGNRDGYLRQLRALAAAAATSPLRAKASRVLAHRRGVPSSGLEGLLVSVWLPWARHRRVIAARQEAPRELDRLVQALRKLAKRAQPLPAAARRRWYRRLRSTRITPTRSCCKGGVRRCESRPSDWAHPTWRILGFDLSGPHLYRYQLTLEPGSVRHRIVIRALGDLDCNGRSSLLQRIGIIDSASGTLKFGSLTRVRADD